MWGARFYDQFGEKPSDSWIEGVGDLTTLQIREALTKIRNSGASHPVSLPEFRAIARNVAVQHQSLPAFSTEALASHARRLQALIALRNSMPKDAHGHVVHSDYVPPYMRAKHEAIWQAWHAEHPGGMETYVREQSLLMTGRAPS